MGRGVYGTMDLIPSVSTLDRTGTPTAGVGSLSLDVPWPRDY